MYKTESDAAPQQQQQHDINNGKKHAGLVFVRATLLCVFVSADEWR